MDGNISRIVRLGAGLLGLLILGWVLTGQAAQPILEGYPTDWTHRHVIFSQPTTTEQVLHAANDPRYWQQWYRQHVTRVLATDGEVSSGLTGWNGAAQSQSQIQRDWAQTLGAGGTVGAGNFPAKYAFRTGTANCASAAAPDFVVFSTGLSGSGTQASIVAFNNLYSGCTSPPNVPNTYWAYNTGGQILTSPVFSQDGTQLAFVQTSAGAASLVLLRWKASTTETVGGPMTLTSTGSYFGCTAPCMTTIPLTSGTGAATNDTTSSVFYDYTGDTAWVGDASSWLHQFTHVFRGTPAEVRTSPWPVQVNATTPVPISSPVHDQVSGNVFVTDQSGFLYRVATSNGAVTATTEVDWGTAASNLVSGPIVDVTNQLVYVFASNDGLRTCPGGVSCSAVHVFITGFPGAANGTNGQVGTSSATPNPLYEGSFDSTFYASNNGTGNLYVCGDTGVNPILYRVPVLTGGNFGTAEAIAPLTAVANHRACSPVTDVLNPNGALGPEERVFFGVVNNARPTACANAGCAQSFISMQWTAGTSYNIGQEVLVFRTANSTHYINTVVQAGTSGGAAPNWPNPIGTITNDGGVKWINQGATQVTAFAGWVANHAYALRARIFDGKSIEVVTTAGTSGGAAPTWPTTAGATTSEGPSTPKLTWTNAGLLPSAALAASGGTSGIIIDNTVAPGALGTSELYFSTLGNQNCPTTSTGCAVQASQSALQ